MKIKCKMDKYLYYRIILVFLLFALGILVIIGLIQLNAMGKACDDFGGVRSNFAECRKGNTFYAIKPMDLFTSKDYVVNKYPKIE